MYVCMYVCMYVYKEIYVYIYIYMWLLPPCAERQGFPGPGPSRASPPSEGPRSIQEAALNSDSSVAHLSTPVWTCGGHFPEYLVLVLVLGRTASPNCWWQISYFSDEWLGQLTNPQTLRNTWLRPSSNSNNHNLDNENTNNNTNNDGNDNDW